MSTSLQFKNVTCCLQNVCVCNYLTKSSDYIPILNQITCSHDRNGKCLLCGAVVPGGYLNVVQVVLRLQKGINGLRLVQNVVLEVYLNARQK